MTTKFDVVIGAAYGDEGKGRVVADLAFNSESCVVIRFNGGAQAAHTVVHKGKRHIFSHFSSGTFSGATTFFGEKFVIHPHLFNNELLLLEDKGIPLPPVVANKRCQITTIFDVALNIMLEKSRGKDKHGSCGAGFGETIQRGTHPEFALTAEDLFDKDLAKKLDAIRFEYMPFRLDELQIDPKEFPFFESKQQEDEFADAFYLYCMMFLGYDDLYIAGKKRLPVEEWKHFIFEGAQGLQLDQDHGTFPHVTRSNTGLSFLKEKFGSIGWPFNVHYVTRTYTTRHGAGPLPHELDKPPYCIEDKTNQPNDHQGSLRFSYLNLDTLREGIHGDIERNGLKEMTYNGVMTCCDQLDGYTINYIENDQICVAKDIDHLAELYGDILETNNVRTTWNPEIDPVNR